MALVAEHRQVQARARGAQGTQVLPGHRASPIHVAAHHDPYTEMVASAVFLGRRESL